MVKMCGSTLLLLFSLAMPTQAETLVLDELFGAREDSMAAVLIGEVAGVDSANIY